VGVNLADWPKCATPVGFLDDVVAALQRPAKGATDTGLYAVAKTKYVVASGDPAIVQLEVPTLFSRSTLYIALTPDSLDASGRFEAATGWPLGCPTEPTPGVVLDGARCTALTIEGVRARAQAAPDPAKTYRLVRIPAADPSASPPAPDAVVPSPSAPAAAPVPPPPQAAAGSPPM
jgi:hypothetical protein